MIGIREFTREDALAAALVWNEVVDDGEAFPQTERLDAAGAETFFGGQSFTGLAADSQSGEIVGLYILHPNNVGRCAHIANASYAVKKGRRGEKTGEALVRHSLDKAKELGFRIMQFNAVVATNAAALALYEKIGFMRLGTVPGGFLMKDGHYEDIVLHYYDLK